jgi:meso-butanediol dehydrogenase/(S,S)-butanediol dehydrogenase/diacetyl reductase
MGRFDGKVVVITGTSSGQGAIAAQAFAREGATIVGCGRSAEKAQATAELVRADGGEMLSAALDLTDPDAVAGWIGDAVDRYGRIDILYNNAGEPRFGPPDVMSVADWRFTISNELDIVFHTTRVAWPHLARGNGGASIINVASIAGMVGVAGLPQSAHAATKHGIVGLTRQFAAEGAPLGIRANCISPGLIDTPATSPFIQMGADGPLGQFMGRLPLGRPGRSEEVVRAALFLASDDASYITGVNLPVDGGVTVLM